MVKIVHLSTLFWQIQFETLMLNLTTFLGVELVHELWERYQFLVKHWDSHLCGDRILVLIHALFTNSVWSDPTKHSHITFQMNNLLLLDFSYLLIFVKIGPHVVETALHHLDLFFQFLIFHAMLFIELLNLFVHFLFYFLLILQLHFLLNLLNLLFGFNFWLLNNSCFFHLLSDHLFL